MIYTKIVGVTFDDRQASLEKLQIGDKLELKRERENPFDKNAVQVAFKGEMLGYIKKELAEKIAAQMDKLSWQYSAEVLEVTGKDKGLLGCNIEIYRDIERENEIIKEVVENEIFRD